jgi:lipopolysaccharide transport system permease protein
MSPPSASLAPDSLQETVIEPDQGLGLPRISELRPYSDLLRLMVRRDVAVRYRQTAAGALWAVFQPVALAGVFSVFLGLLAKVPSQGDIPYPLYAFSGMVMWLYFSTALQRAADSTVESADLISKVYFPRIIIPIVAVTVPIADFVIGFAVLVPVMLLYGFIPGPEILLVPAVLALAVATAFGAGLWLSALNVRYRDVGFVVPFLVLVGLFVTPIIYPFGLVPEAVQPLYAINPMVGVLEAFRWCLFGEMSASAWLIAIPAAAAILLTVTGAAFFQRAERSFADIV